MQPNLLVYLYKHRSRKSVDKQITNNIRAVITSIFQDYPSVSHLAYRVSEENINIIFAIIDRLKAMADYKPLTSLIRASVVVKLEEDSANIVDVIKENYKVCAPMLGMH